MNVRIQSEWKAILNQEFEKPYFNDLVQEIKHEIASGETIFPSDGFIARLGLIAKIVQQFLQ